MKICSFVTTSILVILVASPAFGQSIPLMPAPSPVATAVPGPGPVAAVPLASAPLLAPPPAPAEVCPVVPAGTALSSINAGSYIDAAAAPPSGINCQQGICNLFFSVMYDPLCFASAAGPDNPVKSRTREQITGLFSASCLTRQSAQERLLSMLDSGDFTDVYCTLRAAQFNLHPNIPALTAEAARRIAYLLEKTDLSAGYLMRAARKLLRENPAVSSLRAVSADLDREYRSRADDLATLGTLTFRLGLDGARRGGFSPPDLVFTTAMIGYEAKVLEMVRAAGINVRNFEFRGLLGYLVNGTRDGMSYNIIVSMPFFSHEKGDVRFEITRAPLEIPLQEVVDLVRREAPLSLRRYPPSEFVPRLRFQFDLRSENQTFKDAPGVIRYYTPVSIPQSITDMLIYRLVDAFPMFERDFLSNPWPWYMEVSEVPFPSYWEDGSEMHFANGPAQAR